MVVALIMDCQDIDYVTSAKFRGVLSPSRNIEAKQSVYCLCQLAPALETFCGELKWRFLDILDCN